MLGENFKEIHEHLKHHLGNLTVTAMNSELSNRKFLDKVQIIKEKGALKINEFVTQQDKWTEKEIIDNQERLSHILLSIFRFPELNDMDLLKVKDKSEQLVEHEKGQNYTNQIAIGYELFEGYKERKNWIDIFMNILQELSEYEPIIFNDFVKTSKWFSNKEFEGVTEIKKGVYLVRGISNWNKFNLVDKLMDLCSLQPEELKIKNKNKNTNNEE